ncbi:PREDICTED: histone acetyltransferase p300-like [Branchiostoma belcheri]|uniref:Histone acetyltransferase p300-like n=1 Tax=Branchiostoma belcheri TaxID=7741 RepID=A0A6P5AB04_BRABE|nr:PREDICTED: histone acetyltransferase p300-like [Branchiostoma belcheri]
MVNILRSYVASHQRDWDVHLPAVRFAYNTSCHATTKFSPFFLMHGREARLPVHLLTGIPFPDTTIPSFVTKLNDSLPAIFHQVQQHTSQNQCRQKELFDRRVHGEPYAAGDLVLILNKAVGQGLARKLARKYNGPYRVLERVGDQAYKVQNTRGRREVKVIHFENLKPFTPQQLDPDYDPGHDAPRPARQRRRNNQPSTHSQDSDSDTPPSDSSDDNVHSEAGPITPQGLQSSGPSSSSFPGPPASESTSTRTNRLTGPARTTPVQAPVAPALSPAPTADNPVLSTAPTADDPVLSTAPTADDPVLSTAPTADVPVLSTAPTADVPVLAQNPVQSTAAATRPPLPQRQNRRRRRPEHLNNYISIPDSVPSSDSESETDHFHPNVCQVTKVVSQDVGLTGQCHPSDRPCPRGESLELDPSPPPLKSLAHESTPKRKNRVTRLMSSLVRAFSRPPKS